MQSRSRIRADIAATVGGLLFSGAAALLGAGGSVPCCGLCANAILWVITLAMGSLAGLVAALIADWARIEYERGIAAGALLGARAGLITGIWGGSAYAILAGLARLGFAAAPGGGAAEQQAGAQQGFVMLTLIDAALNIGAVPLTAALAGSFWGVVVGAIRRDKNAAGEAEGSRRWRPGYVTILYALSGLVIVVLVIATLLQPTDDDPRWRSAPSHDAPHPRAEVRSGSDGDDVDLLDDRGLPCEPCDLDCDGEISAHEGDVCDADDEEPAPEVPSRPAGATRPCTSYESVCVSQGYGSCWEFPNYEIAREAGCVGGAAIGDHVGIGFRSCCLGGPCGADRFCAPGSVCRAGSCAAVALAPADRGFVDARGGSEWGNRCFEHLRAERLDGAEAACARGLAIADRPSTRGALLYNLGRVAEARGEVTLARTYYERSLEARPGNAAVRARLDALPQ